ncbi:PDDEXK nuclease domain-containing protein [Haliangium sp.]|uniref:PDDEXK nuclease domain-containing protein n=1 Tax=Haliangium sp. TaxID=2663208 RepID=UPI003D10EACA
MQPGLLMRPRYTKPTSPGHDSEDALYERIAAIIDAARGHVARSVNTAMVHAYWLIGREIVEVEQSGKARAEYGEGLIERLAQRLSKQHGKGFSARTLRRVRQFYLTFPDGSKLPPELGGRAKRSALLSTSSAEEIRTALLTKSDAEVGYLFPPSLGWTHYLALLKINDDGARAFYEIEAAREGWSTRQLERQIASLLYERLAKSRDKEGVHALAQVGQDVGTPTSVLKDPFVLEFLGLAERPQWQERDLEQAIIDRLEAFLLELGKGFCFVARQKRITFEGDHFYIDLVFYNRLLRCFVLVDLKLGKLTHQDLGQVQMYVNYYDRYQRAEWEEPTVGIVLCSDKNDAMVKITMPKDNQQIYASRYRLYLPTEDELRDELERQREAAERTLRLATKEMGEG